MSYRVGCHTVFHHRYHIVWVPKYRYKVLEGVRDIVRQVCKELRVEIINGILSRDHVHIRTIPISAPENVLPACLITAKCWKRLLSAAPLRTNGQSNSGKQGLKILNTA